MSNAEMPPLAVGQVWRANAAFSLIRTISDNALTYEESAMISPVPRMRTTTVDALRSALVLARGDLLSGPGAPWSPAEEVPHA